MEKWPIGVFTSIDEGLGVKFDVVRELGVPTIQLHAPSKANRTRQAAEEFLAKLDDAGVVTTAVFGGFAGESYADIPTVAKTVGLVPAELGPERTKEMYEIADFAKVLKVDVVALHLGFVPHDKNDPLYGEVLEVTQGLCEHCRANGQALHLETGQETADALVQFIKDVGCNNLFVNFDPANMILYGSGKPLEALEKVGEYVRSVHCKDALWAENPGNEWGQEVKLGAGQVNIEEYLRTLDRLGYTGPLTIEREIPQDPARQKREIGHAVSLLEELKTKIG